MMDRAVDSGAQVYVDDSFGSMDKLRTALRVDSQKQSQLAIQKYQEIIDEFGQKLVYLNNDFYVSLTDYVRARMLAIPAVQKGQYDQFYGSQARKLIDAAVASGDVATLLKACDRYFPSAAAVSGLGQAAEWYFERGEFVSAARIWRALLTHPRAGEAAASFLHHAALAEHLAAHPTAARELSERLARDFPDTTATIDGNSVNLLDNLDTYLKTPAWSDDVPMPDEWPSFQGGPTRSNVPSVNSSAGARLWAQSTLTPGAEAAGGSTGGQMAINGVRLRLRMSGMPGNLGGVRSLNAYPVLSGGTIYLNANQQISALNANAGTLLWSYPRDLGSGDASNQPNMGLYNNGNQLPPPSHDSCTVFGARVFAILPAPFDPSGGNVRYMGGYTLNNSRLVALDRHTGAELWSVTSSSLPPSNKGTLVFVGSPIATRQGVFVVARRAGGDAFTQLYLVRLDTQTGKVDWTCYLCSASSGGYYGMTAASLAIPMTTLADDMVYITTGQGAECAVDANAGRILWLQVTELAHAQLNSSMMYGRPVETAASWKLNPPLIWKDQLITAESGSAIRIYERFSGRLLNKMNPKDLSNAVMVPGIVGDTLITVGAKIHGVDLRTGKPAFEPIAIPTVDAGVLAGRAFVTTQYLYLPAEKALMMVNLEQAIAGGKLGLLAPEVKPQLIAWPRIQGPDNKEIAAKSGNLLVTSEQVLVLTEREIAGYSRWETARDKRLALIRQTPTDPRPYMDLAEVAFRTAHLDLARQNMQQAVELARRDDRHELTTSPAATESTATLPSVVLANDELLTRLYRMNLTFAQQLLERKETEQRDEARFYFQQCQLTARTPETNAEWRLLLAPLTLTQQHFAEAATLYNDVLTDSGLRNATFRRRESITRAGLAAESRFRELIAAQGTAALAPATQAAPGGGAEATPPADPAQVDSAGRARIYQPFETQAQTLLARARSQQDATAFRSLIDSYPNSLAALAAATDLANLAKSRQEPLAQIAALRWAYARTSDHELRGRLAAEQSQAYVALKRYAAALGWLDRGAHHVPELSWQNGNVTENFASLRRQIIQQAPELTSNRAPKLALTVVQPGERPPAPSVISSAASLLVPLETNRLLRRPDLVAAYDAITGKVTFINTPTLATRSTGQMSNPGAAVLLGYVANRAVLATPSGATAFDLNTGALAWEIPLELSAAERAKREQLQQRLRNIMARSGAIIINGGGGMGGYEEVVSYGTQPVGIDSELVRSQSLQQLVNPTGYSTMRIIGNQLVVLSGHELKAFNLTTGKQAWLAVSLPEDGLANVVLGNDDLLLTQVDNADTGLPQMILVDAATGRNQRTMKLEKDRIFWRALGDDGVLYCAGDSAVAAYEITGDSSRPRWRRNDLHPRFPAAITLTLDGLVCIDANNDLLCLAQENGESRWARPRRIGTSTGTGDILSGPNGFAGRAALWSPVTAALDGDNINVLTPVELAAYRALDGADAWQSSLRDITDKPPLVSAQIGAPYLVVLASGPTRNTQRAVNFYLINRANPQTGELTNGRLEASPQIKTRADSDAEGPVIQDWQVVDGGIALEINRRIYLYHPAKLAEPTGGTGK